MNPLTTNVNLPNRGQIANLPQDAVVETNALIDSDSVRPVIAGALPPAIHEMVARHAANQETILQAARTKDRRLAFEAFLRDPLVRLDAGHAEELFGNMLRNTKDYLPGWQIG